MSTWVISYLELFRSRSSLTVTFREGIYDSSVLEGGSAFRQLREVKEKDELFPVIYSVSPQYSCN